MAGDARLRILEATYTCVARYGLAKTTVEDAARVSGMARATIYRYFPGGRDQLVAEVIAWEAERFFERLAAAVGDTEGLEELLEEALFFASRPSPTVSCLSSRWRAPGSSATSVPS